MRKQITKILIIIFSIICLGLLFYKVMAETYDRNEESDGEIDIENFDKIRVGDYIVGINVENTILSSKDNSNKKYYCIEHKKALNEGSSIATYEVTATVEINKDVATVINKDDENPQIIDLKSAKGENIARFVRALAYGEKSHGRNEEGDLDPSTTQILVWSYVNGFLEDIDLNRLIEGNNREYANADDGRYLENTNNIDEYVQDVKKGNEINNKTNSEKIKYKYEQSNVYIGPISLEFPNNITSFILKNQNNETINFSSYIFSENELRKCESIPILEEPTIS